ncbi:hypothetical protein F5Y17DRAFT_348136 [Xylariaceae sp. FL0594]|nr:hypothetical protein F5Y17DRAFT_348136 [Xylariaceae sp. FL0594]
MGIKGLLPLLKSIHRPTELKKYEGETFGVDAYGWLHRGAISCAIELAEGKPTRKYVDFAMKRVRMARHFGVEPYLVFDGDFLPSKAATEASRAKRREEARKAGLELLKAGKPSQAHQELQKAIDVTPEMARHLIEALKRAGVSYVVAPYEADAQLVYLERKGIISGIISDDSDLLVFGAKRLITKLDQYGHCIEINRRDFNACREVSFIGWDDAMFRRMAILSGCDYLDGLPNFGLKTAHRMLRKHKTVDRVVRMLQFEGKHRVPEDYLTLFKQAEQTFLYQWAFCPTAKQLVNLTALPGNLSLEKLPFIGSSVEPAMARQIATGDVDPISKIVFTVSTPSSPKKRTASGTYRSPAPGKPIESYFGRHRRIPLGEMDTAFFGPNPQRTSTGEVRQIVFPLPRPYITNAEAEERRPPRPYLNQSGGAPRVPRRQTEPITNLLTNGGRTLASQSRRTTTGAVAEPAAVHNGNTHNSNARVGISPRPPKKARLCEDGAVDLKQGKEKSKFFVQDGSKVETKTKRDDEGLLMSDDSIEQVLLELPDFDGWSNRHDRRKTFSVYEGESLQTSKQEISKDDDITGPDALSNQDHDDKAATVPGTPPKPSLESLDRFAYAPETSIESQRQSRRISTTSSARSSLFSLAPSSAARQPSTAQTTPATTPLLTPLQRLGKKAIAQSMRSSALLFSAPRPLQRSSLDRLSLDLIPVNPAFVSLPQAVGATPYKPVGSEDLLISESDTEELKDGVGEQAGRRMIDLSQYRYN